LGMAVAALAGSWGSLDAFTLAGLEETPCAELTEGGLSNNDRAAAGPCATR